MKRRPCPSLTPLAAALLFLGWGLTAPVQAQSSAAQAEGRFQFSIAAQPLAQALDQFSRVTGLALVYTSALPPALGAPSLEGSMSAAQALQRLLAGSGYGYRQVDGQTLTIEPLAATQAMNLDGLTVTAEDASRYSYQPSGTPSITRSGAPLLEVPQTVNVVPAQVLRDQKPRNLDDALNNISGITQANTLGST